MKTKLWAGRFSENTDPQVEAFTASITFDVELFHEDILGSLAHANMLNYCQILTNEDYQKINHGLLNVIKKVTTQAIDWQITDEDIHTNIEKLLHIEIGETAGKLHTARSRNDQVALDLHLYLRNKILVIIELLMRLQDSFLELANQHQQIIMAGYTHLQRAQPVSLSLYWLAYASMLQRDIERLKDSWVRVNQCPLGAAALAGTSLPIDRHYVAALLDFDGIYLNTMDAVSDRDFVVEFLANAALIMMHLSRLSEELILWSSHEFNFIHFADAFCTGSSIMPQKKNPDVSELVRGKTGRVYGDLFAVLTMLKGLPLAYNKDLQEDKEPLFDAIKTICAALRVYIPLLATTTIHVENMQAAASHGFLNAASLAEYLVKKGLSFRVAHEIVGKMVGYCVKNNRQLENLSLQEMQQWHNCIDQDVYQALTIEHGIAHQNVSIHTNINLLYQKSAATYDWIAEKKRRLMDVQQKILTPA